MRNAMVKMCFHLVIVFLRFVLCVPAAQLVRSGPIRPCAPRSRLRIVIGFHRASVFDEAFAVELERAAHDAVGLFVRNGYR